MSQSNSDEEFSKFELYEIALKDAKNDINELLKKKQDINYRKIVLENLVYDPDEGIHKNVIEDLQDRMIIELKGEYKASSKKRKSKKRKSKRKKKKSKKSNKSKKRK